MTQDNHEDRLMVSHLRKRIRYELVKIRLKSIIWQSVDLKKLLH